MKERPRRLPLLCRNLRRRGTTGGGQPRSAPQWPRVPPTSEPWTHVLMTRFARRPWHLRDSRYARSGSSAIGAGLALLLLLACAATAAAAPPSMDDNAGLDQYLESAPEPDGGSRSRGEAGGGGSGGGAGSAGGASAGQSGAARAGAPAAAGSGSASDPDAAVSAALVADSGGGGEPARARGRGAASKPGAGGSRHGLSIRMSAAPLPSWRLGVTDSPAVAAALAVLLLAAGLACVRLAQG